MPLIATHLGGTEVSQHAIQENNFDSRVSAERLQNYQHSFLEIHPSNVILSTVKA